MSGETHLCINFFFIINTPRHRIDGCDKKKIEPEPYKILCVPSEKQNITNLCINPSEWCYADVPH